MPQVPSQETVYQFLLGLESKASAGPKTQGTLALFLHEGLGIEALQYVQDDRFQSLITADTDHRHCIKAKIVNERLKPSPGVEKEIKGQREKLRSRLNDWRTIQTTFIPTIDEYLMTSVTKNPEEEKLFLPSDFSMVQRTHLGIVELAQAESQLREGAAFDALSRVQTAVKVIVVLRDRKKKDAHGQEKHTRALSKIHIAEAKRDLAMNDYNRSRLALIALDTPDADTAFPLLSLKDTFRKSTLIKRSVGDSRRTDGVMWTYGGVNGKPRRAAADDNQTAVETSLIQPEPLSGTQVSKSKKRMSFSDRYIKSF